VLTPVFEAIGARRGSDATHPSDYLEAYAPVEPLERGEQAFS